MGTRGKIFISYRRDDAPGDARSIRDRLARKFGEANVFMDVDRLLAGQRFDRELDKALSQCDVLLAVIGFRWTELLSAQTGKRDFVREEIAAALKRDVPVIPVLVGREEHMPSLPQADDLPEEIRDLVLYQKHAIAHESFGRDAAELIAAIHFVLGSGSRDTLWRTVAVLIVVGLLATTVSVTYWTEITPWTRSAPKSFPRQLVTEAVTTIPLSNSDGHGVAGNATVDAAKQKATEKEVTASKANEVAAKQVADQAASKAAADAKAGEEATRKVVDEEAARKKVEQANLAAVMDCDRLAAAPSDRTRPSGVAGVDFDKINPAAATSACEDAVRRNPDIVRLVFQAGRAAEAQKDYISARDRYWAAIAKGSAAAMANLGHLFEFGYSVALDYDEARKWYGKAAALGNPAGMLNLGKMYENGRGVSRDYSVARNWYEKAAAIDFTDAMSNLGMFYEKGLGVAKDKQQARIWYQKAADGGDRVAKAKLESLK